MKVPQLTLILLILVLATLGLSLATRSQTPSKKASDIEALKRYQEKKARFPVADYDEPDLTDPKMNQARKEKKLRHDNFRIVAKNRVRPGFQWNHTTR